MYEGQGGNKNSNFGIQHVRGEEYEKMQLWNTACRGVRNMKNFNFGKQHVGVRNLTAISSPYVLMCTMRKLSKYVNYGVNKQRPQGQRNELGRIRWKTMLDMSSLCSSCSLAASRHVD